jgi:hypothetical protein
MAFLSWTIFWLFLFEFGRKKMGNIRRIVDFLCTCVETCYHDLVGRHVDLSHLQTIQTCQGFGYYCLKKEMLKWVNSIVSKVISSKVRNNTRVLNFSMGIFLFLHTKIAVLLPFADSRGRRSSAGALVASLVTLATSNRANSLNMSVFVFVPELIQEDSHETNQTENPIS